MRWPEAGVDPFPSPHRGEPTSLRADIVDELADHLALAVENEVERNGQSQEGAWTRALERFGNPDAVARRLWWDTMKERDYSPGRRNMRALAMCTLAGAAFLVLACSLQAFGTEKPVAEYRFMPAPARSPHGRLSS
jgi:hypothetical protein